MQTGQGIASKGSEITCDNGVYLSRALSMTSLGGLCRVPGNSLQHPSLVENLNITSSWSSQASSILSCSPKQSLGYPACPTELTAIEGLGTVLRMTAVLSQI